MNKLLSAAAAALLLWTAAIPLHAAAEEPPQDIRLTVETKEFKAEEVPSDGYVELKVYAENLPAFRTMQIVLEKDAALSYSGHYAVPCDALDYAGGMSFTLGNGSNPNFLACNLGVVQDEQLKIDGEIIRIHVYLPDTVHPGDFYGVRILRTYDETYRHETYVKTDEAIYGESYFTELASGGIRILPETPAPPARQAEQPAPEQPVQQDSPDPQQDGNSEPDTPQQNETTASAAVTTAAASTTASLTTAPAETTSAAAPVTETTAALTTEALTESLTTPGTTSAPAAETAAQKPEEHSASPLYLFACAMIGAAAGTGTVVLIRRKHRKQNG